MSAQYKRKSFGNQIGHTFEISSDSLVRPLIKYIYNAKENVLGTKSNTNREPTKLFIKNFSERNQLYIKNILEHLSKKFQEPSQSQIGNQLGHFS